MLLEVLLDQRLQESPLSGGEGLLLDEDVAERPLLGGRPGGHGGNESVAADEVQLQREDPEQQVAVAAGRRGRGHAASLGKRLQERPCGQCRRVTRLLYQRWRGDAKG